MGHRQGWKDLGGWWGVAYCFAAGQLAGALGRALFPGSRLASLVFTFIACFGAGLAWGKYQDRRKP